MTTQQIILMNCFYLAAFVIVAYFTRATSRRIAGALIGAVLVALLTLIIIALGETIELWKLPINRTPKLVLLLYSSLAFSCAPIYLISWRVARRFGCYGLVILIGIAAVVGPVRDYAVAAMYPEWIVFAQGPTPIMAVGATYAMVVGAGHAVMRIVAGTAMDDKLAVRRWNAT